MTVRFDALFQHSPNAYMVLDRDLRYLEANPAYELLTGMSRAQLVGQALFELFPGTVNPDGSNQADVLRASLERVLATGERDTLALCDQLEASLITGETTRSRMLDALLHEALSPTLRNAA